MPLRNTNTITQLDIKRGERPWTNSNEGSPLPLPSKKYITIGNNEDGDTIEYTHHETGQKQKIRIEGLNAPEKGQIGGLSSKRTLKDIIDNKDAKITIHPLTDANGNTEISHGRTRAIIRVNGKDISELMGELGAASYTRNPEHLPKFKTNTDTLITPELFRTANFLKKITSGNTFKGMENDFEAPEIERQELYSMYKTAFQQDKSLPLLSENTPTEKLYKTLPQNLKNAYNMYAKSRRDELEKHIGVNLDRLDELNSKGKEKELIVNGKRTFMPIERGVELEKINNLLKNTTIFNKSNQVIKQENKTYTPGGGLSKLYDKFITPQGEGVNETPDLEYGNIKALSQVSKKMYPISPLETITNSLKGLDKKLFEVLSKKEGGILKFANGSNNEQLPYNISFDDNIGMVSPNSQPVRFSNKYNLPKFYNSTSNQLPIYNKTPSNNNKKFDVDGIDVAKGAIGAISTLFPLLSKTTSPNANFTFSPRKITDQVLDTSGYRSQIANNFSNYGIRQGSDLYAVNAARMNNATSKTTAENELNQRENEFRLNNQRQVNEQINQNIKEKQDFDNKVAESNYQTGVANTQAGANARSQSTQNLLSYIADMANEGIGKKTQEADVNHFYNNQKLQSLQQNYNNQAILQHNDLTNQISRIDNQLNDSNISKNPTLIAELQAQKAELIQKQSQVFPSSQQNYLKEFNEIIKSHQSGGKIDYSKEINKVILNYM